MNPTRPEGLVQALLPLVRQFSSGPYGIAMGGSYAKGIADPQSDLDIYLFAETVLPAGRRSELTVQALGQGAQVTSWGQDGPFVEGGTDLWHQGHKIEVWLRNSRCVASTIAACRQGRIQRECVCWTVMGFFNYALLSDVRAMRIVEDPHGILAGWQRDVLEYPEALRQAILARFSAEAGFWPENFHYRTAVERADVIYTSGIVQQVAYALIQVVFALNRQYFPGEKKLAQTLAKLPTQPRDFVPRLQALLHPSIEASVEGLQAQRRELASLVAEVEALMAAPKVLGVTIHPS